MKASKLSLAAVLAASLASSGAAASDMTADVAVTTAAVHKPGTVLLRVEPMTSDAPYRRRSIRLGHFFEEGKPLEMTLWGSGGAVIGSLGGPAGALIGAGAGALCGLVYSVFAVPHNGPSPRK